MTIAFEDPGGGTQVEGFSSGENVKMCPICTTTVAGSIADEGPRKTRSETVDPGSASSVTRLFIYLFIYFFFLYTLLIFTLIIITATATAHHPSESYPALARKMNSSGQSSALLLFTFRCVNRESSPAAAFQFVQLSRRAINHNRSVVYTHTRTIRT